MARSKGTDTMQDINQLKEFIDEVAPNHNRTSCTDEQSNGNEYFNEFGYPRCVRCAMLHRLRYGIFPYGVRVSEITLRFSDNERITEG